MPNTSKTDAPSPETDSGTDSGTDSETEESSIDVPMPLTEHLEELRTRMVQSIGVIFVGFLIAVYFEMERGQPILSLLRYPLEERGIPLVFDELTEPFFTYVRVALYTSLFFTFPIIIGQIWLFVRPAMYKSERTVFLPFVILSYPLFVGGGLFGYFMVLPMGYDFFLSFQTEVVLPSLQMGAYLSLTIQLLFAFGAVFELPTIAFILTRLGIIDAAFLRENRKYSIVTVFIAAAILTPPDVFTQTLMAAPLIILYEISIWVSWFAQPKKSKKEASTGS